MNQARSLGGNNVAIAPSNSESYTKIFRLLKLLMQSQRNPSMKISELLQGTYVLQFYSNLIKAVWFTYCP